MFKELDKKFKSLCTPASVYFIISFVAIVLMVVQNLNAPDNKYCIGNHHCRVDNLGSKVIYFVVKLIYVLFWTWVLNLICNSGHKNIAWFLVLLPIVGMFVVIAALISMKR